MATQNGDPLARALARELIAKLGIRDPEDIDIELIELLKLRKELGSTFGAGSH